MSQMQRNKRIFLIRKVRVIRGQKLFHGAGNCEKLAVSPPQLLPAAGLDN